MTKIFRMLLTVGTITAVILIFIVTLMSTVPSYRHFSPGSERVEINATEQSRINLGLSSDFDARPRWLSDGMVRIIPTLGMNFDFLQPNASMDGFVRSVKVSVDDEPSDGESGLPTKRHRSYETGIRIYLSPTIDVGVTYGKRYEGNSVTTSIETGFRL